jgi:hypothetical protein
MHNRRLALTPFVVVLALLATSPGPREFRAASVSKSKEKSTPIDLKGKFNHSLKADFHVRTLKGNNLDPLPRGKRELGGVKFFIGEGMIQLGSTELPDRPAKVEGIEVGRTFKRLHILHATGWQAPEGALIGTYTIHYADKTKATIEIVYGKDVRDWWDSEDKQETTRGKRVWEGRNEAVKGLNRPNCKIRLFLTTWVNPMPRKLVDKIDYAATEEKIKAAPFCVAMTVENE